jgi:hypothetical protein
MCKEMPVILVNRVVDKKKIIITKLRVMEEERHKGLLTQKARPKLARLRKMQKNVSIPE